MSKKLNIGIVGASGRVGRLLVREILSSDTHSLSGGLVSEQSDVLGKDLATLAGLDVCGIRAEADVNALIERSDALIDFSTPALSLDVAQRMAATGKPLVIGTTGFSEEEKKSLQGFAERIPLLWSSNMSVGVNLLAMLVQQVALALDDNFDIEILEMHHRHKVDAPSGTALMLGEAAAKGRSVTLAEVARKSRDGLIGARPRGEIGFATLRGGDVIGEHSVLFAGEGERVTLSHSSSNRAIYAKGAIRAVEWLSARRAGMMYSMQDVLR